MSKESCPIPVVVEPVGEGLRELNEHRGVEACAEHHMVVCLCPSELRGNMYIISPNIFSFKIPIGSCLSYGFIICVAASFSVAEQSKQSKKKKKA